MKILNYLDRAKAIARGNDPYPISFEIDPSNVCNHRCIWCMYKEFMQRDRSVISKRDFYGIIDQIIALGGKSITFTGGGEPLSNPETINALSYVKQKGASVALITNGGLLDSERCRTVVKHCSYVRISLDAGKTETHSQLHRPRESRKDNFTTILDNIGELIRWKKKLRKEIKIGIGYLVHPLNNHEVIKVIREVKQMGADYIQIRPVCDSKGNFSPYQDGTLTEFQCEVPALLELGDEHFDVFPLLHRFDELQATQRGYEVCRAHTLVGIVGADCNVYLCCQLKGQQLYNMGNLKNMTFDEIWRSQRRRDIIDKIDISKCPPCRYNKYNEVLEYLSEEDRIHREFL